MAGSISVPLQVRGVHNLFQHRLKTTAGVLDFDLDNLAKRNLYKEGFDSALEVFRKYAKMSVALETAAQPLKEILGKVHLRLAVFIEIAPGRLKGSYNYGRKGDPDEALEIGLGRHVLGECWNDHEEIAYDPQQQTFPKRATLTTGRVIPLFDPQRYNPSRSDRENLLVGLLVLDSDVDLVDQLADPVFGRTLDEYLDAIEYILVKALD